MISEILVIIALTLLLMWLFVLYCVWAYNECSNFLKIDTCGCVEFIGITLHPVGKKCTVFQWAEGSDAKINVFLTVMNYSFYVYSIKSYCEDPYYRHECYFRILPFVWIKFLVAEY